MEAERPEQTLQREHPKRPECRSWTCTGCEVSIRNAHGELIPEPAGWNEGRCVVCQRQDAFEQGGREDVLRFELLRGTKLKVATKRARMTLPKARALRTQMIKRGEMAPLEKQPGDPEHFTEDARVRDDPKLEGLLKADPTREDRAIARELGCDVRLVRRRRALLGLPPPPTTEEKDAAVLREFEKAVTILEFSDRVGVSRAQGGKRLKALAKAGLAEMSAGFHGSKLYRAATAPGPPSDPTATPQPLAR